MFCFDCLGKVHKVISKLTGKYLPEPSFKGEFVSAVLTYQTRQMINFLLAEVQIVVYQPSVH